MFLRWLLVGLVLFYSQLGLSYQCRFLFTEKKPLRVAVDQKIREICRNSVCTTNDAIRVVEGTIKNRLGHFSNLRAYMAITSVIIGVAGWNAIVVSNLGAQNQALAYFVTSVMASITSVGVYVIGSPVWEAFQPKLRRITYKLLKSLPEQSHFDQQYIKTSQELTLNQQMSRANIERYIYSLTDAIARAKVTYSRGLGEQAYTQIAEILFRLQTLYPDIDPKHPLVVDSVQAVFPADYMHTHRKLADFTFKYMEKRGMEATHDHVEILKAWFPGNSWDTVKLDKD